MYQGTTVSNELVAEATIELALSKPNKLGIERSRQISEFISLTEDFINCGYSLESAEVMASNIIEV